MGKVKVKFTRTYTVNDADRRTYEEGKTYEMSVESAQHFVNRRAAVVATRGSVSEPETASMTAPETAVKPPGKPRTSK
jgi:hypothetical protein